MEPLHFTVHGIVRWEETRRAAPGLVVRAYDKDLLRDDPLGESRTDAGGRFSIRFTERAFRDLVEQRPDVYLRVFDVSGTEIHSTRGQTRRNSRTIEPFELRIPRRPLP